MKTNLNPKKTKLNFSVLFLLISISTLMSCNVVENIQTAETNASSRISRKERVVKVYPDLVKKLMHVKNTEAEPLDFFVFDLEGTLIRHFKMQEKDHKKIAGLEKGLYVYQVFTGDEMSESGKITIK